MIMFCDTHTERLIMGGNLIHKEGTEKYGLGLAQHNIAFISP